MKFNVYVEVIDELMKKGYCESSLETFSQIFLGQAKKKKTVGIIVFSDFLLKDAASFNV